MAFAAKECSLESRGTGPTDTRYGEPLLGAGIDDYLDRAEAVKECTRRDTRDAWDRREHRFSRRPARPLLAVGRPQASSPLLAAGENLQPQRRVLAVSGADDADAELVDRQERTADRGCAQWPGVEIIAFDEEVRPSRSSAQASDLQPEAALDDRQVQVADGLPLDQRIAHSIVRHRQPLRLCL